MPTPIEERIPEVKAGLAARWTPLIDEGAEGELQRVTLTEPAKAPSLPFLSIQTSGFRRRGLETPQLQTAPIQDPIGGRVWIFNFDVRLWVNLAGSEDVAQEYMDALLPRVVVALEDDRSLGGIAVDSAIASGDTIIVSPTKGQALLVNTCKCSVETEEAL